MPPPPLPHITATRFVQALREGGSLPGLIEADDGRLWVVKFRGAGQGVGALVAEVIAGRLAAALALPMPDLAVLTIPPKFGVTDGDPEVNDLLTASVGTNLAMAFLPAAVGYDPAAKRTVDAALAARVVAFDVLISNIDRTYRNPNLLWSGDRLWLIDHGAALYWQHSWDGSTTNATARLPRLTEHVLAPLADDVIAAATAIAAALDDAVLADALAAVPDAWLGDDGDLAAARRAAFVARLAARRPALPALVAEVARAQ
ncbi:MAG: aminotransferase class I and II [Myxococcales bacterium]|nr:aminotransferase class I and II [Myxococcales bacterium]